ncbi:hypothetical protein [Chitinophaga sp. Cy-1792]|uniref:hypothetical protein n=1 Tax=Chitinophaga sp. Cy-1792 TaxID=2608339 RepID=UPI0019665B08|nr:hypothetical protein [Chitinophaga sp. Cy-1792]
MQLKTGKDEIVYLLTNVLEKFESTTGQKIVRNSNRKNYEAIAILLSDISNQFPLNQAAWQHQFYEPDYNPKQLTYPSRKYDITGNQIKDACYNQIVAKPRAFLVDACYIYLYGVGRKGFEQHPTDPLLLATAPATPVSNAAEVLPNPPEITSLADNQFPEISQPVLNELVTPATHTLTPTTQRSWQRYVMPALLCLFIFSTGILSYQYLSLYTRWTTIRKDFNLIPYQPTAAEISQVEGLWQCYTGSPQARVSQPDRYHLVVPNIIEVKYKDGYFTYKRYGANFNHSGYIQFEGPGVISIHTCLINYDGKLSSPRHSLMQLQGENSRQDAISASWNFDAGNNNKIIGIREVYTKIGKGGSVQEILNSVETAACHCKIISWQQQDGQTSTYYLKNVRLESLPDSTLHNLLDEKSMISAYPQDSLIQTRPLPLVGNGLEWKS